MTHAKITQAVTAAKEFHRTMLKLPRGVERLGARTYRNRYLAYARDMIDALAQEDGQPTLGRRAKAAMRTLERLGYTYQGGELWKPPLGERRPAFQRLAMGNPSLSDAQRELLGHDPYRYRQQLLAERAQAETTGVFDYDPAPRITPTMLPDQFALPLGGAEVSESGFTSAQAMHECLQRMQVRVDKRGAIGYDAEIKSRSAYADRDPLGAFRPGQFLSFVRRTDDLGNFVHERHIVLATTKHGMRIANVDTALTWQINGHAIGFKESNMDDAPGCFHRVSAVYPLMPTDWVQTCLDNRKREWLKEAIKRLDESGSYSKKRELMSELASVGLR